MNTRDLAAQLQELAEVLQHLEHALDALEQARSIPDEIWEATDPQVMAVLDHLADVESMLRPADD